MAPPDETPETVNPFLAILYRLKSLLTNSLRDTDSKAKRKTNLFLMNSASPKPMTLDGVVITSYREIFDFSLAYFYDNRGRLVLN